MWNIKYFCCIGTVVSLFLSNTFDYIVYYILCFGYMRIGIYWTTSMFHSFFYKLYYFILTKQAFYLSLCLKASNIIRLAT